MKLCFTKPTPFLGERPANNIIRQNFKTMAREGTVIDMLWPETGYSDPTYAWTEAHNAVEGVKLCYKAWKTGYDGIIIGCAHDPGLIESRSIVDIPVVGVTESSIAFASSLGTKFSFLCLHQASASLIADKIRRYGLVDRLASIRCIDLSPAEAAALCADPAKVLSMISELVSKAVREDEAEVIIIGCTLISSILTSQNICMIDGVPLIDPVWAGVKMAEVLVDLKKAYGIGVCRKSIYSAPIGWEEEIPIKS